MSFQLHHRVMEMRMDWLLSMQLVELLHIDIMLVMIALKTMSIIRSFKNCYYCLTS